jgi:transposase
LECVVQEIERHVFMTLPPSGILAVDDPRLLGMKLQSALGKAFPDRLQRQIEDLAPNWSMAPVVEALQAMRGVAFVTAVTVVAEVGDSSRFDNPRQLMSNLGLTPSEHSSGAAMRPGGITKAGNALARRVSIEGAWTCRMQARVSRKPYDWLERLPQAVCDVAWKAQVRLCARYRRLAATGKAKVVVTTAVAREMVGFLWAIARQAQAGAAA